MTVTPSIATPLEDVGVQCHAVRRAAVLARNGTPLPARPHPLNGGVISAQRSDCIAVVVLTANEKVVAFDTVYREPEFLIECLCVEVVGANGQLKRYADDWVVTCASAAQARAAVAAAHCILSELRTESS